MRKVQCHDCGKRYDFDVDDFCPRCGSFTIPPQSRRIGADGSVIRVEGINERNHKGSFVHEELHEENRERKGSFLEGAAVRRKSVPSGTRLPNRQTVRRQGPAEVTEFLNELLGLK